MATGDFSQTQDDQTLSAGGTADLQGHFAVSQASQTIASSGTVVGLHNELDYLYTAFERIEGEGLYSYFAGLSIEGEGLHSYGNQAPIEGELTYEYGASPYLEYELITLVGSSEPVEGEFVYTYGALPALIIDPDPGYNDPAYDGPPAPAVSPWYLAWARNEGELTANYSVQGKRWTVAGELEDFGTLSIDCLPDTYRLDWAESNQAQWAITIADKTGYYHPLNEGSPWYGIMREEGVMGNPTNNILIPGYNLTPQARIIYDNQPKVLMNATTHWGAMDFPFQGIGTSFTSRRNDQDLVYNLNWKGQCRSVLLFAEGQTMPTVLNRMSKDVLAEILNTYNVPYNLAYLPDNFLIKTMQRFDGRPIDWIVQILGVSMADWILVNGVTFTPYLPNIGLTSSIDMSAPTWVTPTPHFVYNLSTNVIKEQVLEGSLFRVINDVTSIMAVNAGGYAATKLVVTDFKEYKVTLPTRMSAIQWRVLTAQGGQFSDYIFRNEGGQVTGVREPRPATYDANGSLLQGSSPVGGMYSERKFVNGGIVDVKEITVTWGNLPNVSNSVTSGYGEIVFFGTAWDGSPVGVDPFSFQGNYLDPYPGLRARSINLESVKRYGRRPVVLQPNSLIPDQRWAQIHADRVLTKYALTEPATYTVPYNPAIVPGTIIKEINEELSYTKYRVVSACSHSASKNPADRSTTYTGRVYRPFTLQHIAPFGQVSNQYAILG